MKLFFRHQGQGQPLIILHGLLGSSDNWHSLGKLFAETFSVYLIISEIMVSLHTAMNLITNYSLKT
jgi:hypothetical protein